MKWTSALEPGAFVHNTLKERLLVLILFFKKMMMRKDEQCIKGHSALGYLKNWRQVAGSCLCIDEQVLCTSLFLDRNLGQHSQLDVKF